MMVKFITKDGKYGVGMLLRKYLAFEGDMKYIILAEGREIRCHLENNQYVEM